MRIASETLRLFSAVFRRIFDARFRPNFARPPTANRGRWGSEFRTEPRAVHPEHGRPFRAPSRPSHLVRIASEALRLFLNVFRRLFDARFRPNFARPPTANRGRWGSEFRTEPRAVRPEHGRPFRAPSRPPQLVRIASEALRLFLNVFRRIFDARFRPNFARPPTANRGRWGSEFRTEPRAVHPEHGRPFRAPSRPPQLVRIASETLRLFLNVFRRIFDARFRPNFARPPTANRGRWGSEFRTEPRAVHPEHGRPFRAPSRPPQLVRIASEALRLFSAVFRRLFDARFRPNFARPPTANRGRWGSEFRTEPRAAHPEHGRPFRAPSRPSHLVRIAAKTLRLILNVFRRHFDARFRPNFARPPTANRGRWGSEFRTEPRAVHPEPGRPFRAPSRPSLLVRIASEALRLFSVVLRRLFDARFRPNFARPPTANRGRWGSEFRTEPRAVHPEHGRPFRAPSRPPQLVRIASETLRLFLNVFRRIFDARFRPNFARPPTANRGRWGSEFRTEPRAVHPEHGRPFRAPSRPPQLVRIASEALRLFLNVFCRIFDARFRPNFARPPTPNRGRWGSEFRTEPRAVHPEHGRPFRAPSRPPQLVRIASGALRLFLNVFRRIFDARFRPNFARPPTTNRGRWGSEFRTEPRAVHPEHGRPFRAPSRPPQLVRIASGALRLFLNVFRRIFDARFRPNFARPPTANRGRWGSDFRTELRAVRPEHGRPFRAPSRPPQLARIASETLRLFSAVFRRLFDARFRSNFARPPTANRGRWGSEFRTEPRAVHPEPGRPFRAPSRPSHLVRIASEALRLFSVVLRRLFDARFRPNFARPPTANRGRWGSEFRTEPRAVRPEHGRPFRAPSRPPQLVRIASETLRLFLNVFRRIFDARFRPNFARPPTANRGRWGSDFRTELRAVRPEHGRPFRAPSRPSLLVRIASEALRLFSVVLRRLFDARFRPNFARPPTANRGRWGSEFRTEPRAVHPEHGRPFRAPSRLSQLVRIASEALRLFSAVFRRLFDARFRPNFARPPTANRGRWGSEFRTEPRAVHPEHGRPFRAPSRPPQLARIASETLRLFSAVFRRLFDARFRPNFARPPTANRGRWGSEFRTKSRAAHPEHGRPIFAPSQPHQRPLIAFESLRLLPTTVCLLVRTESRHPLPFFLDRRFNRKFAQVPLGPSPFCALAIRVFCKQRPSVAKRIRTLRPQLRRSHRLFFEVSDFGIRTNFSPEVPDLGYGRLSAGGARHRLRPLRRLFFEVSDFGIRTNSLPEVLDLRSGHVFAGVPRPRLRPLRRLSFEIRTSSSPEVLNPRSGRLFAGGPRPRLRPLHRLFFEVSDFGFSTNSSPEVLDPRSGRLLAGGPRPRLRPLHRLFSEVSDFGIRTNSSPEVPDLRSGRLSAVGPRPRLRPLHRLFSEVSDFGIRTNSSPEVLDLRSGRLLAGGPRPRLRPLHRLFFEVSDFGFRTNSSPEVLDPRSGRFFAGGPRPRSRPLRRLFSKSPTSAFAPTFRPRSSTPGPAVSCRRSSTSPRPLHRLFSEVSDFGIRTNSLPEVLDPRSGRFFAGGPRPRSRPLHRLFFEVSDFGFRTNSSPEVLDLRSGRLLAGGPRPRLRPLHRLFFEVSDFGIRTNSSPEVLDPRSGRLLPEVLDLGSGLCTDFSPKSPTSAFAPTFRPRSPTSGPAVSLPEVLDLGSGLCTDYFPKSPTSVFAPTLRPRSSTPGPAVSLPEVLDLGSGLCTDFSPKSPTSAFAPTLRPRSSTSGPAVSLAGGPRPRLRPLHRLFSEVSDFGIRTNSSPEVPDLRSGRLLPEVLDLDSGLCTDYFSKSPTSAFAPTLRRRSSTSGPAASLPEVLDLGSGLCTDYFSKSPTSAFAPALRPRSSTPGPAVSLPEVLDLGSGLCTDSLSKSPTSAFAPTFRPRSPTSGPAVSLPEVLDPDSGLCTDYFSKSPTSAFAPTLRRRSSTSGPAASLPEVLDLGSGLCTVYFSKCPTSAFAPTLRRRSSTPGPAVSLPFFCFCFVFLCCFCFFFCFFLFVMFFLFLFCFFCVFFVFVLFFLFLFCFFCFCFVFFVFVLFFCFFFCFCFVFLFLFCFFCFCFVFFVFFFVFVLFFCVFFVFVLFFLFLFCCFCFVFFVFVLFFLCFFCFFFVFLFLFCFFCFCFVLFCFFDFFLFLFCFVLFFCVFFVFVLFFLFLFCLFCFCFVFFVFLLFFFVFVLFLFCCFCFCFVFFVFVLFFCVVFVFSFVFFFVMFFLFLFCFFCVFFVFVLFFLFLFCFFCFCFVFFVFVLFFLCFFCFFVFVMFFLFLFRFSFVFFCFCYVFFVVFCFLFVFFVFVFFFCFCFVFLVFFLFLFCFYCFCFVFFVFFCFCFVFFVFVLFLLFLFCFFCVSFVFFLFFCFCFVFFVFVLFCFVFFVFFLFLFCFFCFCFVCFVFVLFLFFFFLFLFCCFCFCFVFFVFVLFFCVLFVFSFVFFFL
ncbi:hypothetical protein [Ruegeria sp.]|uniref:hypothetical protein n=1 Tax=Ruegeria sp. TaxID=1879320 RepID=UPI003AFF9B98